jgi:hypothetical protein
MLEQASGLPSLLLSFLSGFEGDYFNSSGIHGGLNQAVAMMGKVFGGFAGATKKL